MVRPSGGRVIEVEYESQVNLLTDDGTRHKKLQITDNRIIYSDCGGNAVNCVDVTGKQIWQYKQDLSGPYGLCADTFGNNIAADCDSKTIKAISKDDHASKVLVRNDDILYLPKCVCFNHQESYSFVCD
ncbi:Hypothetical predicted protein [Mytilus galloprovincialis]|uniref:Uncharacterized protein n=1 Tax=Mytilus galloprovincialis TaxID=29158 RepID=A0A8B6EFA1_MYTGA|nr:Hypothetical predicted protein [Mytilus galloprovincialis]